MTFSHSIPDDIPDLKKAAESSFSTTPDSSLREWFSFDQMQKYIKEGRGMCIKAVSDEGEIVGMIYAQQENPINGKEGLDKWVPKRHNNWHDFGTIYGILQSCSNLFSPSLQR